jgi:hypothetical protein
MSDGPVQKKIKMATNENRFHVDIVSEDGSLDLPFLFWHPWIFWGRLYEARLA